MNRLGLLLWLGHQVESWIGSLPQAARLPVAIILILWSSAICSAIIDNIPFTAMMLRIVVRLGDESSPLGLPLQPLVWALAFGACLGGISFPFFLYFSCLNCQYSSLKLLLPFDLFNEFYAIAIQQHGTKNSQRE